MPGHFKIEDLSARDILTREGKLTFLDISNCVDCCNQRREGGLIKLPKAKFITDLESFLDTYGKENDVIHRPQLLELRKILQERSDRQSTSFFANLTSISKTATALKKYINSEPEKIQATENEVFDSGLFGLIYKVTYQANNGKTYVFAEKKIREHDSNDNLLAEIDIFEHMPYHPSIIGFILPGPNSMLLEFANEGNLFEQIRRMSETKITYKQKAEWMEQMFSGLEHLGKHHIIHCDLKPRNLLIDQGSLKICDFGFSVPFDPDKQTLPLTRKVEGTRGYIAPEYEEGQLDHGQDVYCGGVISWQLFYQQITPDNFKQFSNEISAKSSSERNPLEDAIYQTTNPKPEERVSAHQACSFFSNIKNSEPVEINTQPSVNPDLKGTFGYSQASSVD